MRPEFFLAALIALGAVATAFAAQDCERALSVAAEVERIAAQRVLWPGFDPLTIPLAVYTGESTYLFRHPSPPEDFSRVRGTRPEAFAFEGRYPTVIANSSAEVGGRVTATVLADGTAADLNPAELAAIAVHEAFHVYQRARHQGWSANEGNLLLYPTDSARLLGLRRLESAALRRALDAGDRTSTARWTRIMLGYRCERFAGMDSAFSTYERLTELNEGLATYVQLRAAGTATVEIPAAEYPATRVRLRAYSIGAALAFVLDRLRPGWQAALEEEDEQYLDGMLGLAVGKDELGTDTSCDFAADEVARIERTAERDAAAVMTARIERRKAFDSRSGWRLIVTAADGQPLWPKGFDPLNVERVDGGLLHTRFLGLGNESGELQAIDESGADVEALTEGIGPHPLFNGVRRVIVAGLAKPEVGTEGRQVSVRAAGLALRFTSASVEMKGTAVVVRLEPQR